MKSVLSELYTKEGLFASSYIMQVDISHNFPTPMSEIELRAVQDACEHAGAREFHLGDLEN